MNYWDMNTVRSLIFAAGRTALEYFDFPSTEHKADDSLVTAADRKIEAFFRDALTAGEGKPGAGDASFIGEETSHTMSETDIAAALHGSTWVVDPIDGTAPYANHLPTWGLSIGYVDDGVLTRGALFVPRTGELLISDNDGTVLLFETSRDPHSWDDSAGKSFSAEEAPYRSSGMISLPQEIANRASFRGRNPMQANGSAVYSVVQMILGGYLSYVARIKLWDLAGAVPLLWSLGFRMEFTDGRLLDRAVTTENWILDPSNPRCWKSTDLLFLARSAETIAYVRDNYEVTR